MEAGARWARGERDGGGRKSSFEQKEGAKRKLEFSLLKEQKRLMGTKYACQDVFRR